LTNPKHFKYIYKIGNNKIKRTTTRLLELIGIGSNRYIISLKTYIIVLHHINPSDFRFFVN